MELLEKSGPRVSCMLMSRNGWLRVEQKRVNTWEQRSECSTLAKQWSLYEDVGPVAMGVQEGVWQ